MKPERKEYAGRRIEIHERDGRAELLIDGTPVPYGRLPNGKYYLDQYAYDWTDSLIELAQRFVDYQHKTDKIRQEHRAERRRAKGGD
jgi:hypothetical protein